jgi:hypothetical protein
MTIEMLSQRYAHHHSDHLSSASPLGFAERVAGEASGLRNADFKWSEWQDLNLRPPRPERVRIYAVA